MSHLDPPPPQETPADDPQYRNWMYRLWEFLEERAGEPVIQTGNDDAMLIAFLNRPPATPSTGGIYYDFTKYGGVADGVSNNSSALSTLITTVTNAGGGTIYFPEGIYAFSNTITTADNCKITFLGDGQSSVLLALAGADPLVNAGSTTTINFLKLDGAAISSPIVLIDSGNTIGIQWARYILNSFFASTLSPSTSIRFGSTQTFTGYGTVIHNCRFDLVSTSIIIQRFGADTINNRRIFSHLISNSSSSIDLTGFNGILVTGCDMTAPIMNSATNPANCVIVGNRFSLPSPWTVLANQCVIQGNTLIGANNITLSSVCNSLQFGPNSVDAGATITVNCFSAGGNSVYFPRRGYLPTVSSPGFSLGDGQLLGNVQWLGQFVSVQIGLRWGSTTSTSIPGAGIIMALPTTNGVNSLFGNVSPVGTGFAFNGGAFGLYCYCNPATTGMLVGNMNNNNVTSFNDPITPVNTNRYLFNLHYSWL